MQIKKFFATTLREAMNQMKEELGDEAVILRTGMVENDNRFENKKMFELVACIEDEPEIKNSSEKIMDTEHNSVTSFDAELKKISKNLYRNKEKKQIDITIDDRTDENETPSGSVNDSLNIISDRLKHNEVAEKNINTIIDHMKKYGDMLNVKNIERYLLSSMASLIPTKDFKLQKNNKPKVVALIGPTGVGKTTCIAKLAIISKILHNLDVGLISIDTYRLGAIDQLRIFSEVSNIDMLVAYEAKDMTGIMETFKKKDVIFIDTAGRSQKNFDNLKSSSDFLYRANVDETYLVMSATNNLNNLYDVAESFRMFDYDSIIFSKIDEAVAYGNILNVATKYHTPISFLANGQVIPDDIIAANSEFIANLIYSGNLNK